MTNFKLQRQHYSILQIIWKRCTVASIKQYPNHTHIIGMIKLKNRDNRTM